MAKAILNAATELFKTHKYQDVTIEDIAKQANCSAGNIYHYFKNKEELCIKALGPPDDEYVAGYAELKADPAFRLMSLDKQLIEFFCMVTRVCTRHEQMESAYIYAINNPGRNDLSDCTTRDYKRICLEILTKMKNAGMLRAGRDPELIFAQMTVLMRGILVEWTLKEKKLDPVELTEYMCTVLLAPNINEVK